MVDTNNDRRPWFRRNGTHLVYWSIMLAQFVLSLALVLRPQPVVVVPAVGDEPPVGMMGWVNDPEAVKAVVATLPHPVFAATPAGQQLDEPDHVYLWDAARKATGDVIPCRNQGGVGSCVSFGTVAVVEALQCVQIVAGQPIEFKPLAQEIVYGGSRVQIGHGQIRGDGSSGAWAAKWCQDYGVVARGKYPGYDLSEYSESTCRKFGSSGCPKALEPTAKERPVRAVSQVSTAADVRKALASGYPVTVASNQGFSMTRDSDGFCRAQGSWAHQMAILGYQKGSRPGFWIQNSWGPDAFQGPEGTGQPPKGGFWADEKVVNRMVAQGDSFAYSDLNGFPARRIDWPVRLEPQRRLGAEVLFALAP